MNYYKRHIGDYAAKAGHLSPLEHGVYTLILDAYYNREQGPTEAEAIRWARARNPDETQAVSTVLQEFFVLQDGRYTQGRVEDELAAAKAKAEHNRTVGKLGGRPPRARKTKRVPSGLHVGSENNPNPLIHESTTKEQSAPAKGRSKASELTLPEWIAALDGGDAIVADDPLFGWAEQAGIPREWIALAWWSFEARYSENEKRYADWRKVFRRAVKEDWLKLWRVDRDGGFALTTAGEQVRREMGR